MTIPSRSNVKGDNDNQVRGIKNFLAFQYKRIFKKWLTTLTKEILLLFEYKFEHKIDYHNYPLFQDLKFEAGDVFIFFLIWAPMFLYTLFLFKKRVHMYVTYFATDTAPWRSDKSVMDRQTDRPSYSDARTQLKMFFVILEFLSCS